MVAMVSYTKQQEDAGDNRPVFEGDFLHFELVG